MSENQQNNGHVDAAKLNRMIREIYTLESKNTKTGEFSDTAIKEKIEKIIEEEANKCY